MSLKSALKDLENLPYEVPSDWEEIPQIKELLIEQDRLLHEAYETLTCNVRQKGQCPDCNMTTKSTDKKDHAKHCSVPGAQKWLEAKYESSDE